MNIGILTIGDEILIGQIVDTNTAYIAKSCTNIGARVTAHTTVADDVSTIVAELGRMAAVTDVLITTGGLGSTHDDRTVEAIATCLKVPLVENNEWLGILSQRFTARGRVLSDRNRKQALVPAGAQIFTGSIGTAPGFRAEIQHGKRSVPVYVLPGVPFEMQHLITTVVINELETMQRERGDAVVAYRTLITSGIPESSLADLLGNTDAILDGASLAYLPSLQGVRLRIGVAHADKQHRIDALDRIETYIRNRASQWIIGTNTQTLSSVVGSRLHELSQTVAVAESCTGGLLGAAFTDVPGSSAWFYGGILCYTNQSKIDELDVPADVLLEHGAVSEEVAKQLASAVRKRFRATWGIGITGIAGPDGGTPQKPVGTVWIGIAGPNVCHAVLHNFSSTRSVNRERSVAEAMNMLLRHLNNPVLTS